MVRRHFAAAVFFIFYIRGDYGTNHVNFIDASIRKFSEDDFSRSFLSQRWIATTLLPFYLVYRLVLGLPTSLVYTMTIQIRQLLFCRLASNNGLGFLHGCGQPSQYANIRFEVSFVSV